MLINCLSKIPQYFTKSTRSDNKQDKHQWNRWSNKFPLMATIDCNPMSIARERFKAQPKNSTGKEQKAFSLRT